MDVFTFLEHSVALAQPASRISDIMNLVRDVGSSCKCLRLIETVTGRNDARNKGYEALVSGNRTAMDKWTVRNMATSAKRSVAVSGKTEMCSSSIT